MGPRANLTLTLLVGAATLVIAILIGNEMGNRVLGQVTERGPAIGATPVAPALGSTNAPPENWRKTEVVSVATDPAFPDPRIPPPPPRTPRPYVAPAPTAEPPTPAPTTRKKSTYTSPPLPIPLVTHNPDETPAPDASAGAEQSAAPSEDATP